MDPKPRHKDVKQHYTTSYELIASHYNIPVWSYRDVVLSDFSQTKQANLTQYLTFQSTAKYYGGHPPWHVHLFMADLFGALTVDAFDKCSDNTHEHTLDNVEKSNQPNNPNNNDIVHHIDQNNSTKQSLITLPTPIYPQEDREQCNANYKSLFSVSFDEVDLHTNIGTFIFLPGIFTVI